MSQRKETLLQKTKLDRLGQGFSDTYQGLRKMVGLGHSRPSKEAETVKTWLSEMKAPPRKAFDLSKDKDSFNTWLDSLSADEMEGLTRKIATFCDEAGVELVWLLSEEHPLPATLQQNLEIAILLLALAQWQTSQAASEISLYNKFAAWQAKPTSKENQALSQTLFTGLLEKGLVETPPSNLFLAAEEARQQYLITSIQDAAQGNIETIMDILRADAGTEESAPEPEADEVPAEDTSETRNEASSAETASAS